MLLARVRTIVLLSVLAALIAACGSRVVPLSSGQVPGEEAFGPGQQSALPSTAALPSGAASVLPGTNTPSGATQRQLQQLNKTCVPPAGSTDTGVTQKTIKIGLVVGRTGPLPGQFDPDWQAADAYFAMVNELGGICNRKVQLLIRDDGENGNTDLQVATDLATKDKIFAFVASASAPNDSGIGTVSKKYKIPDIGFPLTFERSESPYTYGVPGQLRKNIIGSGGTGSAYLNRTFGVKQVALFWVDESNVSRLNAWAFEAAMQKTSNGGIKVCYEQPTTVLDSSFTQYVVNMQSACKKENGNIAVYTTMENNNNIKLAQAMRDQNFKPTVFVPTFSSYLKSFITGADGSTEGAYIAVPQVPFERLTNGGPMTQGALELKRYVDALNRYHPDHVDPGSFGAPGWGASDLFTRAATSCGANLTRACIFQTLDSMGPFSANSFLAPALPRDHKIYTLETIVQVKGGRFVEIPHPGLTGPPGYPDFWVTDSKLFDWWEYYCDNPDQFPNRTEKDKYIDCRPYR